MQQGRYVAQWHHYDAGSRRKDHEETAPLPAAYSLTSLTTAAMKLQQITHSRYTVTLFSPK